MEKQQGDEAKGGEHCFCKWVRQCNPEDMEDIEQPSAELQDDKNDQDDEEDEAMVGPKSELQKLWQLFQASAISVAQLFQGSECTQAELSMWDPFQKAALALTNLYQEGRDAQLRSFNLGLKIGYHRRIKDVMEWAKNRQSTILREDLISFLCGKVPPDPPVAPHFPPPSQGLDLQPFQEAIDLHDLSSAMSSISMQSGPPSSPLQDGGLSSNVTSSDLSSCDSEDLALHLASKGNRKRTSPQFGDITKNTPTQKRNRMV